MENVISVDDSGVINSTRGISLLTQHPDHNGFNRADCMTNQPIKYLTCENYEKWYNAYLITFSPDKTHPNQFTPVGVEVITFDEFSFSLDHAIDPGAFHDYCVENGYFYDSKTFAQVCVHWVEDVLDSDWTKLHHYLPTENNERID